VGCAFGQVTSSADVANEGNRTVEKNRGAPAIAEAMIAVAQSTAFAMYCFRFMRGSHSPDSMAVRAHLSVWSPPAFPLFAKTTPSKSGT
jgi:hypothetical protein